MIRKSEAYRKTKETEVDIKLNLDGSGNSNIDSGIKFLDHMLILMCKHGLLDIDLECIGDLVVDTHHTVEDIGIGLGVAFQRAVGNKEGIKRYSTVFTPMDEALSMVAIDISGRGYLHYDVNLDRERVGDFETETLEEFLRAFATNAGITLHVNLNYGKNNHHIIESVFKGLGRAIRKAVEIDERIEGVLSTKGII